VSRISPSKSKTSALMTGDSRVKDLIPVYAGNT